MGGRQIEMKIIVDSNVLLSALIRDSFTRKIIINSENLFYFPEDSLKLIDIDHLFSTRQVLMKKSTILSLSLL